MADTWKRLCRWYEREKRDLPWRDSRDPYAILVSEFMLQQTRVDTVIPYYLRFLERFPDVFSLASADTESVLKTWEGLGYYRRARHLHEAARIVAEKHEGRIPGSYEDLLALPGFGPYTAAAVAGIAHGEAVPVVDGNVLRVASRFWALEDDISAEKTKRAVKSRFEPIIRNHDPGTFNQAIMELGALICTPKAPRCDACPLHDSCRAHREKRVEELPVKAPAKILPHYAIAVGVIFRKGRVLIGKRPANAMLGGLWEFPGGKQKKGESLEETVRREVLEETGLSVNVHERLSTVKHAYSHFRITMTVFRCTPLPGRARAHVHEALLWTLPRDLKKRPFPAANRKILEYLEKRDRKKRRKP